MPADFGAPVASQVNVDPNKGLTTLSNLMSLDQQKQAITSKNIGIEQQKTTLQGSQADTQAKQQAMEERGRITQMLSTGKDDKGQDIRDANGEPDITKILPAIGRIAPFTGQEYAQSIIATHTNKVGFQSAATTLDANQRKMLQGPIQALALDPSDENLKAARDDIGQLVKQHPEMAPAAKYGLGLMDHIDKVTDPAKRTHLANSLSAMLQPGAAVQTQPQAASVDTGPTLQTGTTAPPVAGGGFTATTSTPKDIGPQIIMDAQGQPHYVGTPRSGAGGTGGAFPSKTGVAAVGGATDAMDSHFKGLNAAAQSLPLTTALTKTIEGLAPSAFTGVGGDKKQYTAGVLKAFNMNATGDAQTDTNLLNKAIAQLNISSPAGTDAARALVEAGQPNSKMDAKAIREAAGTIAAQVKMNEAERNFLQTSRFSNRGEGDIQAYQEGRQKFEAVADPRIWQYESMVKSDPNGAREFLARQPDRHELVKKTKELSSMGFFK